MSDKNESPVVKDRVLVICDRWEAYSSYYRPFEKIGEYCSDPKILDVSPERIACAVFTGGADVSPSVYGHKECHQTSATEWRDEFEQKMFNRLRKYNIPLFGICRGAQFLCAMAGGWLIQHCTNHGFSQHRVETADGKSLYMNSMHHQMQVPPEDAEILAWAAPRLSNYYLGNGGQEVWVEREAEVVHYPKINALGVQYHPEIMGKTTDGYLYYQELIDMFLHTNLSETLPGVKPVQPKICEANNSSANDTSVDKNRKHYLHLGNN